MLVTLIEQCLMLFLIIGRWMLPSEMSRDELAQLLLCYIGVAADIIEFFDSFKVTDNIFGSCSTFVWKLKIIDGKANFIFVTDDTFQDPKVNTNKFLCLVVLSIWSWSLLQFTFIISASNGKPKKAQVWIVEFTPSWFWL